jgi:hypothetical protein
LKDDKINERHLPIKDIIYLSLKSKAILYYQFTLKKKVFQAYISSPQLVACKLKLIEIEISMTFRLYPFHYNFHLKQLCNFYEAETKNKPYKG